MAVKATLDNIFDLIESIVYGKEFKKSTTQIKSGAYKIFLKSFKCKKVNNEMTAEIIAAEDSVKNIAIKMNIDEKSTVLFSLNSDRIKPGIKAIPR